jgi:hypothetical protein
LVAEGEIMKTWKQPYSRTTAARRRRFMVDCLTTRFHRCSVIADALATMLAKYENGSSYEGYESTHADTAEFCANAIL